MATRLKTRRNPTVLERPTGRPSGRATDPVPMPRAPVTRRDTRTFRKGTRIPGSDLVLAESVRTVAHKLEYGYGIHAGYLGEWARGRTWDEAMGEFLTLLKGALESLSRMESHLDEYELVRLRRLRAILGFER